MKYITNTLSVSIPPMVCDKNIFRCNHCHAPCDNTYELGQYKAKDAYMGRNDRRTTVMTYYCSMQCFEPMYLEFATKNLTKIISNLKTSIDYILQKIAYPSKMSYNVVWKENPLPILFAYRAYLRFLEACLTHDFDTRILYALQKEAKSKLGDALEEYHTVEKAVNTICFKLSSVDSVILRFFAKK